MDISRESAIRFVEYYYGTFNKNYRKQVTQRENLIQLYTDESLLSYQDAKLAGREKIMEYLLKDTLSQQVKEPFSIKSIPSENNCVFIQVLGDTYFNDEDIQAEDILKLSFAESFYIKLNPDLNSFTIKTQIFSQFGI